MSQVASTPFVALIITQQADGHVAVLIVLSDRKKETVRQFLETIPKRLRRTMDTTCTDMWEGYVNAVKEFAVAHPKVSLEVVVDRYHIRVTADQVGAQGPPWRSRFFRQVLDDTRQLAG